MENPNDAETEFESNESKSIATLDQDKKADYRLIKVGLFLLNAFFTVFIISLYLYFGKGIVYAYENTPELTFGTIMILIRIGIMFGLSFYMFKNWVAQKNRQLKNIPFLVGLFFYLLAISKFLDLLLYIYSVSPNYIEVEFLLLAKIRYFLIVITSLPMLYLGLRPVIYNFGLDKGWSEKKVLRTRKLIVAFYVIIFGFLIVFARSKIIFQLIYIAIAVITYTSIWYIFRFAHKHKIFPTIKANIISWGFLLYLLFSPSRVILMFFFIDILTLEIITLIPEILDFVAVIIIFSGFILKPK